MIDKVVDACEHRVAVVSALLVGLSKHLGPEGCVYFARPHGRDTPLVPWLVGQLASSMHRSQDYAAPVTIRRDGIADKTMWATTFCKAFDRWIVDELRKPVPVPDLTLDAFFNSMKKFATGMLREVAAKGGANLTQFQNDLRRSLCDAGTATISLTRQGPDAQRAWEAFCGCGPSEYLMRLRVDDVRPLEPVIVL